MYKEDAMEKALEGAPDGCPEFLSPPANPFYHIDNGEQSPYGDQLMVLLESLAACKGNRSKFIVTVIILVLV